MKESKFAVYNLNDTKLKSFKYRIDISSLCIEKNPINKI